MVKFLMLTTLDNTWELLQAIREIKSEYGEIIAVRKLYLDDLDRGRLSLGEIEQAIQSSDIILVDVRGQTRITEYMSRFFSQSEATIVVFPIGSVEIFALTRMGSFNGADIFRGDMKVDINTFSKLKVAGEITKLMGRVLPFWKLKDMRNWVLAGQYYTESGVENLKNMLLSLGRAYGGLRIKSVPEPIVQPRYALWWPDHGSFASWDDFRRSVPFDPAKPTIGVLFYGGMHEQDCEPLVRELIDQMAGRANIVPVTSKVECILDAIRSFFIHDGKPVIDVLINMHFFRLNGGPMGGPSEPTHALLQQLDVPVLSGFWLYSTEIAQWRAGSKINPLEVVVAAVLPELDGCIEPIVIGGPVRGSNVNELSASIKEYQAIPERIAKIGERALSWVQLRRKANADKRVAIILYDYPPGEASLGSAGYLDTFASLELFLDRLAAAGYTVEKPEQGVLAGILEAGAANSPRFAQTDSFITVSTECYQQWLAELPEAIQEEMVRCWGSAPGKIMTRDREILVPGVFLGNVFIGIQPARGVDGDLEASYHDRDMPPHHQYLCFYQWLEKEFLADALIHFGMHGTMEFTKGKEIPLSESCYPDVLIGHMPHLYYYWAGNPGEATIAKRRGYAVTLSHDSPVMIVSGLYGTYVELEDLLGEYRRNMNTGIRSVIEQAIAQKAEEANLSFENLSSLELELYRMKRRLIPKGLHVIDRRKSDEDLMEYLVNVLRLGRETPSLHGILAENRGRQAEDLREDVILAEEVDLQARDQITRFIGGEREALPKSTRQFAQSLCQQISGSDESGGLLNALNGGYVLPNVGGDPQRNSSVYPMGRNIYEFDPRLIPGTTAQSVGQVMAQEVLERYKASHGSYPETIGTVLWGFETVKTGGDTIAQILSWLGVKVISKVNNPWFKDLQLIPLEEMGRPRIDVLITICGIFRDLFRPQIELLNRAVKLAAEADEPIEQNFVRKHYLAMREQQGEIAGARIFGPSSSEYGNSVADRVQDGNWREESELADAYDQDMCHAYWAENTAAWAGETNPASEVFKNLSSTIELVTQERDSSEYEVTDLNHYYEFFGGLANSVRENRGEVPEQWIVDSTDANLEVEDVDKVIGRASRTRTLNPAWIDGMLAHDFHGAQKVAERVENLLGLQSTTGKVDNWIFEETVQTFMFDDEMRQRLTENNQYATLNIAERMVEAEQRGYWEASAEDLERLKSLVLDLEQGLE